MTVHIELRGVDKIIRNLSNPIVLAATRKRMHQAGMLLEAAAKANAPVDAGQLRASLTAQTADFAGGVREIVGTPKAIPGIPMEFGTGKFYDGPGAGKGRHWPPSAALDVWARRHGFESGKVVAVIIGRRGGLKPRRYLRDAWDSNIDRVKGILGKIADDVARAVVK
jgi:hypothetical protein